MQTRFFTLPLAALSLATFTLRSSACETTSSVKNIDPDAASKMIGEDADVRVLDIRTPEEFASGHIEGASNIDFKADGFAEKISQLDRETPYILHCRSGARSSASLATFRKLGFQNIYHLDVGMNGWADAGKPVKK